MRGQEVIFPISHFLNSLAHSALAVGLRTSASPDQLGRQAGGIELQRRQETEQPRRRSNAAAGGARRSRKRVLSRLRSCGQATVQQRQRIKQSGFIAALPSSISLPRGAPYGSHRELSES